MSFLQTIFGGSKSREKSDNQAFGQLKGQLTPAINSGVGGINQLGNELDGGFEDYMKNSGFDFAAGEGMRGITGNNASKGLLRSGGTSRTLGRFMDGLKSQRYDNYLGQVGQLGQLGLGAGGLLAQAGQQSTGKSKDSGGGIIGGLASLFSDRSVKEDIVRHAQVVPGLYLYSFHYIGMDMPMQMGFMADEVEKLLPEAVSEGVYGPTGKTVRMVDYDMVLNHVRAQPLLREVA